MEYAFDSFGHENILSTHKTTIEFTKDKDLTLNGDCIVGVTSDFDFSGLRELIEFSIKNEIKKIRITISANGLKEDVICDLNTGFCSDHEIVVRKTDFLSERTLGINANKAAAGLNKKMIKKIKNKNQKIKVKITPLCIKCFIFDFDGTLEEFKSAREYAYKKLSEYAFKTHNAENFLESIHDAGKYFTLKAFKEKNTGLYDRRLWIKKAFDTLKIKAKSPEINRLNTLYWKTVIQKIKPLPNAIKMLKTLKNKKYKLAIATDPDETKIQRIKKIGIYGFFDLIVTGEDVNTTKPDKKFYTYIFKKLKLRPEECVMVGDRPAFDLEPAKELGLVTVWLNTGKAKGQEKPPYIDYEIADLNEIINIFT
ncbi:MAG: HAD-IA family hydrolase [Candidatus Woesearchaeota archaeon]|nr:HAD-IA family hydrolase [Candidatus Woesearchaeota archaeon]